MVWWKVVCNLKSLEIFRSLLKPFMEIWTVKLSHQWCPASFSRQYNFVFNTNVKFSFYLQIFILICILSDIAFNNRGSKWRHMESIIGSWRETLSVRCVALHYRISGDGRAMSWIHNLLVLFDIVTFSTHMEFRFDHFFLDAVDGICWSSLWSFDFSVHDQLNSSKFRYFDGFLSVSHVEWWVSTKL